MSSPSTDPAPGGKSGGSDMLDLMIEEFEKSKGVVMDKDQRSLFKALMTESEADCSAEGPYSSEDIEIIHYALTRPTVKLRRLDLSRRSIDDDKLKSIAQALQVNTTLKELLLCDGSIGDAGAEHLGNAIAINQGLEKLDLSGNKIGDEGAKHIVSGLANNGTLTSLNVTLNAFHNAGVKCFIYALLCNNTCQKAEIVDPLQQGYDPETGAFGPPCSQSVLDLLTHVIDMDSNSILASLRKANNKVEAVQVLLSETNVLPLGSTEDPNYDQMKVLLDFLRDADVSFFQQPTKSKKVNLPAEKRRKKPLPKRLQGK